MLEIPIDSNVSDTENFNNPVFKDILKYKNHSSIPAI